MFCGCVNTTNRNISNNVTVIMSAVSIGIPRLRQFNLLLSLIRGYTNKSPAQRQNPKDVEQMPVYQFIGNKAKRRTQVFTWGYSATGALGNENTMKKYSSGGSVRMPKKMYRNSPTKVHFPQPEMIVSDVAAGAGYTVIAATARDNTHSLFGCGLNTDSQLGLQQTQDQKPLICVHNLAPIVIPLDPKENVIKVACGRAHTICLTNTGNGKFSHHIRIHLWPITVFAFGNNSFGQCGRTPVENEKYFASSKIHQLQFDLDSTDSIIDVSVKG